MYESADVVLLYAFPDDVVCHGGSRQDSDDDECGDDVSCFFLGSGREELFFPELHQPDAYVCCEADEDGVDEEEVEGSEEKQYVACCESVSCGA